MIGDDADSVIRLDMSGKEVDKQMWDKSDLDKQKNLVNQGFFLLFRCPLQAL